MRQRRKKGVRNLLPTIVKKWSRSDTITVISSALSLHLEVKTNALLIVTWSYSGICSKQIKKLTSTDPILSSVSLWSWASHFFFCILLSMHSNFLTHKKQNYKHLPHRVDALVSLYNEYKNAHKMWMHTIIITICLKTSSQLFLWLRLQFIFVKEERAF